MHAPNATHGALAPHLAEIVGAAQRRHCVAARDHTSSVGPTRRRRRPTRHGRLGLLLCCARAARASDRRRRRQRRRHRPGECCATETARLRVDRSATTTTTTTITDRARAACVGALRFKQFFDREPVKDAALLDLIKVRLWREFASRQRNRFSRRRARVSLCFRRRIDGGGGGDDDDDDDDDGRRRSTAHAACGARASAWRSALDARPTRF